MREAVEPLVRKQFADLLVEGDLLLWDARVGIESKWCYAVGTEDQQDHPNHMVLGHEVTMSFTLVRGDMCWSATPACPAGDVAFELDEALPGMVDWAYQSIASSILGKEIDPQFRGGHPGG